MTPTNCKTPKTARVVCLVVASAAFLTLLRGGLSQIPIPLGKGQQSNSNKSSANKDDDFGKVFKGIMAASVVEQERQLNAHGPQFPATYDSSKFSMTGFLKARLPILIEYELEKGAEAKLGVVLLSVKNFEVFNHRLGGEVIGDGTIGPIMRDRIELPDRFGPEFQPGLIGLQARIEIAGKKKTARFELHGLSLGEPPKASEPRHAAADFMLASNFADWFESVGGGQSTSISTINIRPVAFRPSQNERTNYRFVPTNAFGAWAADFYSLRSTIQNGVETIKTTLVKRYEPGEQLTANETIERQWDGLNTKGRPSRGSHRLVIRAWWSKANGAAACVRTALQMITVQ
jgi:hypothetical protein